ncbi:peptidoglycan bridge formation glycyltransferase FemA/FemB family protein [Candidatus Uhrbacteria bacterium]|jgi:peptidoglycan pentaglycine glycine transferase (the first glycine)|nr:peptidoglycan bridge formation glycyltransferase FemA/FemB family protein [Candidatus Uhrbacteria bacterium]
MNHTEWNNAVKRYAPRFGAFLHSWEWGEFQRALGREVERVYVSDMQGVVMAQAVKIPLPAGQFYWYVPKGPFGNASIERQVEVLREQLPEAMFLRIEPGEGGRMLKVPHMQPATTVMLDLSKGEETLLKECKSKTRYNIRLGLKKGVESKIVPRKRFPDFVRLLDQTTNRDQFSGHPNAYYQKMLDTLNGEAKAYLAMGFYEGRPLAANIMIDFAGVRTYLHGASSNLHRNVMAPYALHWHLIADAIEKDMKWFDFWGVAPVGASKKHAWSGISRYKYGFSGEVVEHPGTFDLPVKHLWYGAYRTVRVLRRLRIRL